ncbi:hypothetical protein HU200_036803 [Digitaria exilis]|uniref:mannan endo-1,4-beta-mannosidase n=1 Tax=Digitaria exilis TaxID=1010633 RepID=A0A835BF14_9POAL|nr:hypothetical protein HU200_036803 [Digitaria exilis]
MRLHEALALLLLLCIHGGAEAGGDGFVRVQGTHFVLNGNPFFANGFNAYWLMTLGADPSQRSKAAGAGLSVARTWAFSDGGSNALQYSPGRYNENTFQWAREQGQNIGSDDEFFTNPVVKGFYKNHIKTVLTRVNTITGVAYKDDPTIMAWELMNEPRCQSDLSGRTIQSWITEMAAHVKSIDARHLLEAGLEGFYGAAAKNPSGYQVGTDFIADNQAPGIDFATVHAYPDQWLAPGVDDGASQLRFLGRWLDAHVADARAKLGKPLVVAEFGASRRSGGEEQRDAVFGEVYAKVYESARARGPAAGALFWQLLAEGMDSYGDGYEVVLGQAPGTDGVIATQSRRLQGLARAFKQARRRNGKAGKGAKGGSN